MRDFLFFCCLFLPIHGQDLGSLGALKLPEELEGEGGEEEDQGKDILVIPNRFPKDLNFFCFPRTGLQHDRLCFGQLDAFALACADDTPPLQLVPFCIGFKEQCSQVNYPQETWCDVERKQYKKFCTRNKRQSCKSCYYDLSCSCEPFECIWRRYGFETARWCQRYELFCNNKARREKAQELVALMQDAVKVHYKCFYMFNLAKVICNPFRRQFDHPRCMKFLFDCELISDFDEDKPKGNVGLEDRPKEISPPVLLKKGKEEVILSQSEKNQIKKIQEEEDKLAKEIAKAEAELQAKNTPPPKIIKPGEPISKLLEAGIAPSKALPRSPHPLERITLQPETSSPVTLVTPKIETIPPNVLISPNSNSATGPPKNPFRTS